MFKIFLYKKLLSGQADGDQQRIVTRGSRQRNRRLFDRYNVDQKSLTIMNEQDILVSRDLSSKGFASDVSDRAFDRFLLGDIYESKMRYSGKVYEITIKVAWKRNKAVGFELESPNRETISLFRRLIRPFEIGSSLKEVDTAYTRENDEGKIWLHGDHETDLYIWFDQNVSITAWNISFGNEFVEWSMQNGINTGILEKLSTANQSIGISSISQSHIPVLDKSGDKIKIQFATDVLMSMNTEIKSKLLETINAG